MLGDFKRLRIRDYRVIFEHDGATMIIYEIKHRREAYR
ncbi:MAG: type II toxin-antitoxin system RelE/ParE family toxin [Nitrospirae bacterium]|nr:type II toxin-antitoxin system RelE/ParE family toxin [Nitrospirota bacterium]